MANENLSPLWRTGVLALAIWGAVCAQPSLRVASTKQPADARIGELADKLEAAPNDERRAAILRECALEVRQVLEVLAERGHQADRKADYRRSLALFQAGVLVARHLDDDKQSARFLLMSATELGRMNRNKERFEAIRESLAAATRAGDLEGMMDAYSDLGVGHFGSREYAEALAAHEHALELARQLKDQIGIARSLLNIGNVHSGLGDLRKAIDLFQQCLKLSESIGQKNGVAFALNNLSRIYMQQGDDELAFDHLRRALAIKREVGVKFDIATTLQNLGMQYHRMGRHAEALAAIDESLALSRELNSPRAIAANLINRSIVETATRRHEDAIRDANEALEIARQVDSAQLMSDALFRLATVEWELKDYESSLRHGTESLGLAERGRSAIDAAHGHYVIGIAHFRLGHFKEAETELRAAVEIVESGRDRVIGGARESAEYMRTLTPPYWMLIQLYAATGRDLEALQTAEMIRGRALVDRLRRGQVDLNQDLTADERAKERELSARVSSLGKRLQDADAPGVREEWEQAQRDLRAYQRVLYAAHPGLSAERVDSDPLTLYRIGKLIPDRKTAIVEFAVTPDTLLAFLLTQGPAGPEVHCSAIKRTEAETRAEIGRFREQLARRDIGYRDAAAALYSKLLLPLEAQLRGVRRLAIVPDGSLWQLPFAALVTPREKHLIEERELFLVGSLTELAEAARRPRKSAAGSVLAMGNPALGSGGLPDAEVQVKEIGSLFGPTARVYSGAAASEERFKKDAGGFRVVHLATHGVYSNANPMYSYLRLSQGSTGAGKTEEDGLLEAREILHMKLSADLVVLSACETARGEFNSGEGLLGLSWAFQVAGASTTLVSQWKADSAATTRLMLAFYKAFRQTPGASKSHSLRQASLDLLRSAEYKHPYYWAAFALVGDAY